MHSAFHLLGATFLAAAFTTTASHAASDPQDFAAVARGQYLAVVADCAACHSSPGAPAWAGGRAIETPFGNILAPNITPDLQTGIGRWSDDEFVNSLLKGTRRGGEHLYPAMPYTYFTRVSRNDALAIRAYLNTVPAVNNRVVSNQLPFPFDVRTSMVAWNELNFKPGAFQPHADMSAEWNRGAYLVEGPMHCGMCHTPKTKLGGDETSQSLAGYSLQGWFAPAISGDKYRGLGGWTAEQIIAYLKTGHNDFASASGPMAEEVTLSSSQMTDADLHAVAVYLKAQPDNGTAKPTPIAATEPAMKVGAAIYADECSACHTPTGSGIAGLIPTLAGSAAVQSREPTSLLHVVLRGARSVSTQGAPTASAMPSYSWLLSDDEVAAVTTYVRNAWGNAAPAVSATEVGSARKAMGQTND